MRSHSNSGEHLTNPYEPHDFLCRKQVDTGSVFKHSHKGPNVYITHQLDIDLRVLGVFSPPPYSGDLRSAEHMSPGCGATSIVREATTPTVGAHPDSRLPITRSPPEWVSHPDRETVYVASAPKGCRQEGAKDIKFRIPYLAAYEHPREERAAQASQTR